MVAKTLMIAGSALIAALAVSAPASAQQGKGSRGGGDGSGVFGRMDANRDGAVDKSEADAAFSAAFMRADRNNDGRLTAAELADAVRSLVGGAVLERFRNNDGPAANNRGNNNGPAYRFDPRFQFQFPNVPNNGRGPQAPNAPRLNQPFGPGFGPFGPGFQGPHAPRFNQPFAPGYGPFRGPNNNLPQFQQPNRPGFQAPFGPGFNGPNNRPQDQGPNAGRGANNNRGNNDGNRQGPQTQGPQGPGPGPQGPGPGLQGPGNRQGPQAQAPQGSGPGPQGPGNRQGPQVTPTPPAPLSPPAQPGATPRGTIFNEIDRNGDGVITPDEFAAAFGGRG